MDLTFVTTIRRPLPRSTPAARLLELCAPFGEIEAFESEIAPAADTGQATRQRSLEVGIVESLVDAPGEVASALRHARSLQPRPHPFRSERRRGFEGRRQRRPGWTPGPSIWCPRTQLRACPRWDRSPRTGAPAPT